MSYTVEWAAAAEAMLTRIWLNARDRIRIREAANRVEHRLTTNPQSEGESRASRMRVTIEDPLVVYFRIDEKARVVTVTRVLRPKPK